MPAEKLVRPVFLTCAQVAGMLGVSRVAVWSWCRDGRIYPVKREGHQYLIHRNFVPPSHVMNRLDRNWNKPSGPNGRPKGSGGYYPKGVARPGNKTRWQKPKENQAHDHEAH